MYILTTYQYFSGIGYTEDEQKAVDLLYRKSYFGVFLQIFNRQRSFPQKRIQDANLSKVGIFSVD